MFRRFRTPWVCVIALVLAGASSYEYPTAQGGSPAIINVQGFTPGRDYYSPLPFEHIDAATGNLILSFTDCALPGDGGWNLAFTRTYNANSDSWSFGIEGLPLAVSPADARQDSGTPGGWIMPHFGTADGSQRVAERMEFTPVPGNILIVWFTEIPAAV